MKIITKNDMISAFMVAQDCNMRCAYCYAQGGSYGKKRTLMKRKTAFHAINTALSLGNIKSISFFGGNPS